MGKIMNWNELKEHLKENGITKIRVTEKYEDIPKGTILFFGMEGNYPSTYDCGTDNKNKSFNYHLEYDYCSYWKINYKGEFELIEENSSRKFKVGDRVKRICDSHNGVHVGDIGTIICIREDAIDLDVGDGHMPSKLELIEEKEETPSKDVNKMTTKRIYSVLILDKKTGETKKDVKVTADNEQEAILKTFGVDAENTFIKIEELGSYQEDKPKKVIIETAKQETSENKKQKSQKNK